MSTDKETARKIVAIILLAIEEAGESGIPSGHLYAMLMSKGMSLDTYNLIINYLKIQDLITEKHHLLTAKRS